MSPRPRQNRLRALTLVELMVVIGIIVVMTLLLVPAFQGMKGASDITAAADTIKGSLEQARTHAIAKNTYAWVGFYEEDVTVPSASPTATPGVGRVVVSVMASTDGTALYSGILTSPGVPADPTRLLQIGKLTKIDNIHLKTFTDGLGTGNTFDTRPAATYNTARIGDTSPTDPSLLRLPYPVGSATATAQYTFTKAVQFSPRGEARIDNNNYTLKTVIEIGLQAAHGNVPDANGVNVVAIQVAGVSGAINIYRR